MISPASPLFSEAGFPLSMGWRVVVGAIARF
jgi:hypothetical protein